jgi:hypothetical protein
MRLLREKLVLNEEDLRHHLLFVGSTGAGKSTFARNLAIRAIGIQSSVFFIDPKGFDAPKLLEELPDLKNVVYLEPKQGFAFNPLALPPHNSGLRDQIVSLYIGHFRSLVESWYARGDIAAYAPRMLWIFESLLSYLYRRTDYPTFGDIVEIAHIFLSQNRERMEDFLGQIERDLKDGYPDLGLKTELQLLRKLPRDAWIPILVRLSRFATDPYLSRLFNVRTSNFSILDRLEPGRVTVVRAAGIGEQAIPFFISALVLGVWFAVKYRSEILEKRNLVLLIGDELHTISEAVDLDQILSQGRAFDMGLVFLTQHLYPLPACIRASLLANTHTQIVSKISGEDAEIFLKNWGVTENKEEWRSLMLSSPAHSPWLAVIRTRERKVRKYELPPPPRKVRSLENALGELPSLGFGVPSAPIVGGTRARQFERYLPESLPEEKEWRLMLAVSKKPASFYLACQRSALPRDRSTKEIWDRLISRNALVLHKRIRGADYYELSRQLMRLYFEPNFATIAKSREGRAIAQRAYEYHIERGDYVVVALQLAGETRPDLIAYDYQKSSPIAIEVETESEIRHHAEQVSINARKYLEIGFDRLEIWCPKGLDSRVRELVAEAEIYAVGV